MPSSTANSGLIVTQQDRDRLLRLLDAAAAPTAEHLEAEIGRARIVAAADVPGDVITMNSDVVYADSETGAERTVRLVYPRDANTERGWISVLAPLGCALLGLKVGQEIEWRMPGGVRRIRIVAVPYQPEASGDLTL